MSHFAVQKLAFISKASAPDLGSPPWHYRAIDIKFTTLGLLADGRLGQRRVEAGL